MLLRSFVLGLLALMSTASCQTMPVYNRTLLFATDSMPKIERAVLIAVSGKLVKMPLIDHATVERNLTDAILSSQEELRQSLASSLGAAVIVVPAPPEGISDKTIYRLARDNQAQVVVAPTFTAQIASDRTYFGNRYCDLPKGTLQGRARAYDATGSLLLETYRITYDLHRVIDDGAVCRLQAKDNSVAELKKFPLDFSFSLFKALKK